MEPQFTVVGVDDSYSTLHECDTSAEALRWARDYISDDPDHGGWDRIEIYDERPEPAERLWVWERDDNLAYHENYETSNPE